MIRSPEFSIKTACRVTESCKRLLDSHSDTATPNLSSEIQRIFGLSILALGPKSKSSQDEYARSCRKSRNALLKAIRACPSSIANWTVLALHGASTESPTTSRIINIARALSGDSIGSHLPLVDFQNRLSCASDQQSLENLILDWQSVDSSNLSHITLLQLSLAYYRKCDFSTSVTLAKDALRISPSAQGLDVRFKLLIF